MQKLNVQKLWPHAVAIISFIFISLIYCKPALDGKVLQQSDVMHWKGMSKDIQDYKETHGTAPLWTINMFSGMPGFQIATNNNNYLAYYANELFSLYIPKPFNFFILACLGFYFLGLVLGANPWMAMTGALAYAYSTYDPVIISVGHDTKMLSIAYMPAALGGLMLIFQGQYRLGAAFTALFSSILIYQNHFQIVYYFGIMVVFMTIGHVIIWIKDQKYKHLIRALSLSLAMGLIGILTNAMMLMTTYDYSKATIRGGQAALNLNDSTKVKKNTGGLDTAYAFMYGSYGQAELMTLMIPEVYGGSPRPLGEESKLVQVMQEKGLPAEFANQVYGAFPAYWGEQPGHAGPVYLGALICFLFVFALFYVKSAHKWWLLAVTLLALLMSLGKNLAGFNTFLFENLPLYNKFRAPAMILVIPQLSFAILAVLALSQTFKLDPNKEGLLKDLKKAGLATAGIFALAVIMYLNFDYTNSRDQYIQQQLSQVLTQDPAIAKEIVKAAAADRQSLFASDLMRSLFFVSAAFFLIFLYAKNKLKGEYAVVALLFLTAIDIIPVGKRYLTNDNFLEPEENEAAFTPTAADLAILQDKEPNFRVFNLTQDVFNDAITSYHHQSIGGYHAAKLSLYQDLIENQLSKQPMNVQVLNMLNTKYLIVPDSTGQPVEQQNPGALGSAWLVKSIKFVPDARSEMKALDSFDAANEAIVQESFKSNIKSIPVFDSTAKIQLIKNDNDVVNYSFESTTPQFAVFSEVYYDRGWKAFIDNQEVPIVKTNYVLRGLSVPAGKHVIDFRFEPQSYIMGQKITTTSQIILIAIFLLAIFLEFRNRKKETA